MTGFQPNDPLKHLVERFIAATNGFLAVKSDVDPLPKQPKTQNPVEDIQRNWEEFKRHLQRIREAMVGKQPEVAQRLEDIIAVGTEIKRLTDDVLILNAVDGVVMRATDERAEMGRFIPRLASATDFPTVMAMLGELIGVSKRTVTRRKEMASLLTALAQHVRLRPPPRQSA